MNTRTLAVVVVSLLLLAVNSRAEDAPVPKGLAANDWSSIRAAYDAGRHAVVADETLPGHYLARSPGQGWLTRFDGRGFSTTPNTGGWSWGLDLISYGRGDDQQAIDGTACIQTTGGRVEYEWNPSLTEWYINDQRGFEHGYTLKHRPEGASGPGGMLHFTLAVRGDLHPRVSENGRDVAFTTASGGGATAVSYDNLKVLDADGVHLAASFQATTTAAGVPALVLTIDDAGARYPLTIDPVAQQAYLNASNPNTADQFGWSVAVSGDTAVVGAIWEFSNATGVNGNQADNSAFYSGAAYVFVRSGTTWTQQAYLKASNTGGGDLQLADGDQFGYSVAVSGDTVVVGAPGEDSSATGVDGSQTDNSAKDSGAAYVFVRSGTTWTQQAYLKASNTDYLDYFGFSVSVSGDTVVVGAGEEDSNATGVNGDQTDKSALGAGAAYVFVRSGTTWTQQAYFKASNTGTSDRFGSSIAISGDTVVVGAPAEDSNATGVNGDQTDYHATNAGAAYVFTRTGTTWTQQAYLKASNTNQYDQFGNSVAVSGDTVVIGAWWEASIATGVNGNQADNRAPYSGAAYVFVRSGTTWTEQAYLKASNTDAYDFFGYSVAVSGDTVVVGAYDEDGNFGFNYNSGAAYVFDRVGTTWTQRPYLRASNATLDDRFGWSVAVSGDTVVVGARFGDNNSAVSSGAAYVFVLGVPTTVDPLPTPVSPLATPTSVCGGEPTALSVDDPGADIVIDWFADSCGGTLVGTGNPFYVHPDATTTYFARARDPADANISDACVSVEVTVLPFAVATLTNPLATPASIPSGEPAALSVDDLGSGIVIDWFTGSCNGTLFATANPLYVYPSATTTYFARARDTADGQTSCSCVSVEVIVDPLPTPTSPLATPASICSGEPTALSVDDLGPDIVIDWFTDSCGSTLVGTGNPLNVYPDATTTYFARARDSVDGDTSDACVSVEVIVDPVPTPTSPLATPASVCSGEPAALSVDDLGPDIVIDWFTDSCGGTPVGTGNPFNVNPEATTTYFARARVAADGQSSCSCVSVEVTVEPCAPACTVDYNRDTALNLDDLSDFITDFYMDPTIPGGLQPLAPTYAELNLGYGLACPDAPDAPAPYETDAYRVSGYRVGFSSDGSNACPISPDQNFPSLDNLAEFITEYYAAFTAGGC